MYDAVRTILESHQTVWSENQSFVAGVTKFNSLVDELKITSLKHETINKGIKAERSEYLNDLILKAMVVRDGLCVFAFENNLHVTLAKLDFTSAKLKRYTQMELRNRITTVYELLVEHEAEIGAYGITSEKVIAFMDRYEDFEKQIVAMRKGIIERKFLTARISELEAEIKLLFDKKLDVLVRLMGIEHPEFFSSYKNARILIERKRGGSSAAPHPDDGTSDIGIAS